VYFVLIVSLSIRFPGYDRFVPALILPSVAVHEAGYIPSCEVFVMHLRNIQPQRSSLQAAIRMMINLTEAVREAMSVYITKLHSALHLDCKQLFSIKLTNILI
jgi:hypothetical protein